MRFRLPRDCFAPSVLAMTNAGFTLIELLISVVILAFGLIIIIQSYIHSASGLNASRNYIQAMQLASAMFSQLELDALENNGLSGSGLTSGSQIIAGRQFNWGWETREIPEPDYLKEEAVEACIKLDWKDKNIVKDATLSAYLPKQKQ